jgi:tight adherence protein B
VIRFRTLAAPVVGLALLGGAWASTASAQEDGDEAEASRLVLRAVDSRDPEAVSAVVSYAGETVDDLQVELNGDEVDSTTTRANEAGWQNDVIFVVDTSESTDANGMLTMAQEALRETIQGDSLPAGMEAGIMMAGSVPQMLSPMTGEPGPLLEAVDELTPDGGGGVYEGISQAAGRLDGEVGTIILITDGTPDETMTATQVRGSLMEFGVMLQVVGLDAEGFNGSELRTLAEGSGGHLRSSDDPEDIPSMLEPMVGEYGNTYAVTFASEEDEGVQDITVRAGDTSAAGSYIAGGVQIGADSLVRLSAVEPAGPSFLRTGLGKTIGLLGLFAAAVLFVFGLVSAFVKEDTGLSRVLRPYSDGVTPSAVDDDDENSALAQTAFLKRAVEVTESFAERRGLLDKIERLLERADLPLRAGEALFFYAAGVLVVLLLAFALTSNPLGALVLGLLGILLPPAVINYLASKKKRQFEALLPDTLQLLSSTLRAGYSMMQGVEAVSQEAAEPMGKELRRVVTEARLGRPLEEALDGIAERMESADFGWAVMAIRIQREVGGNLAELLMTVAETMTQRERLRRDVASLTAEGRMSAYVLGGLPIGLGFALWTINPDYIGRLFEHTMGQIMLGGSIIMMLIGFAWMFKIIKIEI